MAYSSFLSMLARSGLLLLACAPLYAQAQATRMMMPDGTEDTYLGLTLVDNLHATQDAGSSARLLPTFAVQWSNGAFLNMTVSEGLNLGMQLSDEPNWQYGPLVSVHSNEQRSDTPEGRRRVATEVGGFLSYDLDRNINLNSQVMYGGGDDGRGWYWQAGALFSTPLSSHHNISLAGGFYWANQLYLQSYFGVTPQQARLGGNPEYQLSSGILNTYLAGEWQWELSSKYWLRTGLQLARLGAGVAHSPLTSNRTHPSIYTGLTYQF